MLLYSTCYHLGLPLIILLMFMKKSMPFKEIFGSTLDYFMNDEFNKQKRKKPIIKQKLQKI